MRWRLQLPEKVSHEEIESVHCRGAKVFAMDRHLEAKHAHKQQSKWCQSCLQHKQQILAGEECWVSGQIFGWQVIKMEEICKHLLLLTLGLVRGKCFASFLNPKTVIPWQCS